MEKRDDVVAYLNRSLAIHEFEDYCPNGLQVQGREGIGTVISGVTASLAFLQAAIDAAADAVLVHHGYFWRGESPVLTGMKYERIKALVNADVSLLAYHLPLDVHPQFGNNAQLASRLGFSVSERLAAGGIQGLFYHGLLTEAESPDALVERVSTVLGRQALAVGNLERPVRRIGWCSGGAQGYAGMAAELGLDAFISGEISEQTTHEARENDLLYIAAGHHATERFGVQALGEHLAQQFDVKHRFIDIDNPA